MSKEDRTLTLRPAAGITLVDPETGTAIPETGATVQTSSYWRRRIKDGDAVLVTPAAAATSPKKTQKEG